MIRKQLRFGRGFSVVLGNRRAQAATMVLPPGESEGDSKNRHRGSDQWLYVESGAGRAMVNGRRHPLRAGTLLVIAAGDRHQITNTGKAPLLTLNLYVPPAYTKNGDPLPRGRR
jgi:mannose-6-phosphate isomerase-like protein (cupin superfamily)